MGLLHQTEIMHMIIHIQLTLTCKYLLTCVVVSSLVVLWVFFVWLFVFFSGMRPRILNN